MEKMTYGEASDIRKQGLLNQITERLLADQGIGESFGKSISSATQAKLVGLKEKFDPVNVAKFATGGSNLATVLVGRLLGRSSQDLNYFVNKGKVGKNKNKDPLFLYTVNQNVQNTRVGDTYADILGKLYSLFKKNDDEEVLLEELKRNFQEEQDMEKQRRDQQLVQALKRMAYKEPTAKTVAKPTTVKEEPTKEQPTERPKPKTFVSRFTDRTKKTTSFVKEHWKPIVVGGAALGVSTGVKAKIAKSEGGDTYNVMNIAPGETRKQSTFDLESMSLRELLSFQEQRGKKYGGRGIGKAAGKYGAMPSWVKTYGPRALGPNWLNEKFSGTNQEKMMDAALQDYTRMLNKSGVPVNDATLYMVHFSGNTKLAKAIMTQPDNVSMRSLMTPLEATQNEGVAKLTVGQYRQRLQKHSGFTFSNNDVGSKVNSTSTENRDLKSKSATSGRLALVTKKQNVNIVNNSTTVMGDADAYLDDSEMLKKQQSSK